MALAWVPSLASVDPEGFDWVDSTDPPGGNICREQCGSAEHHRDRHECHGVPDVNGEEQAGQETTRHDGEAESDHTPDHDESEAAARQETDHGRCASSKRHTNANLACPQRG